jgi:hypothetical protein
MPDLKDSPVKERGGAREGAGHPAFEPTEADRATVLAMAAAGFPQDRIALCLGEDGISKRTMRKYFRREIAIGKDKIDAECVSGIIKALRAGEAWALCYWSKTRMGWRERSEHDHRLVDKDGKDRAFSLADVDAMFDKE